MVPVTVATRRVAALPGRETGTSRRYLRVLEKWMPVGLAYFADWPGRPNCGHFLGGCHWYGLETMAGSLVFALAASSPEYDATLTGCSRETARRMALKGLRYLCFTHDSGPPDCVRPATGLGRPENCGTKWGERGKGFFPESQCGTTVAGMTITALLLGDLVDDETWTLLAAVNEDYARRFGAMPPRRGAYNDTQMEENAWTSVGLASAALFLDRHPEAPAWAATARRWMFSTATTPQDARNHAPFREGATVGALTGSTITTLPDYMAENHGMVHPSYTFTAVGFLGFLGALTGIFGAETPPEAFFNRQRVYDQIKRLTDPTGQPHPPQGMDWPYLNADAGSEMQAAAALLLKDPDAATLGRRVLATLEKRQNATGGALNDPETARTCKDIQDPVLMREYRMYGPAYAYLLHRLYGPGPRPTPEKALAEKLRGVKVYPHSGFVFHRHGKGQTSFAWRNCIMALPLNTDGIYTVAPAEDSLLGTIAVKGHPDSQDLISLRLDEQQDGFAAALVMDRAQGSVRQEVLFASLPNGTTLCWERFLARKTVTVERVEQGFLRLINERFPGFGNNCIGQRTLYLPDGAETFRGFASTDPDSDVVRRYRNLPWLNVDDRLGIIFRGTGETVYHNRHYFHPWWAVADDLTLCCCDRPTRVRAGQVVAELAALIAPNQSHRQTRGQSWALLSCGKHALGLIADGHLAAANFGRGPADITLVAAREAGAAVPIFAGSATVTAGAVDYRLRLQAGEATLRRALATIVADGTIEVTAVVPGAVLARNVGARRATVQAGPRGRVQTVRPGETVALTDVQNEPRRTRKPVV